MENLTATISSLPSVKIPAPPLCAHHASAVGRVVPRAVVKGAWSRSPWSFSFFLQLSHLKAKSAAICMYLQPSAQKNLSQILHLTHHASPCKHCVVNVGP